MISNLKKLKKDKKKKCEIYGLYDENDHVLGWFTKEELLKLLNTTNKSLNCILSRLKRGKTKSLKYEGKSYSVYIYDEVKECMNG